MSKSILNNSYREDLQKKWNSWSQNEKMAHVRMVLGSYRNDCADKKYAEKQLERLEDGKEI